MLRPGLKATGLTIFLLAFPLARSLPGGRAQEIRQEVSTDPALLRRTLQAAGEYCDKVKRLALFYVCVEKIADKEFFFSRVRPASGLVREERIFQIRRVNHRTYTYDYQLIKKGDDLTEDRTLLEENGRKKNVKNAELGPTKYSGRFLVFGPVGFLSFYWQRHFDYAVIGEDRIGDARAVVIRAVPKEKREDNYQVGRIWIGPDFQVYRVEFEPASLEDYTDEVITSRLGDFHKKVIWTVDYSVEKNGVRFPGRQTIREEFVRETTSGFEQKTLKRETVFEYLDYKFFVVETDVNFKK